MEGINQLTTGKLISLSEHEIVDCDTTGEDFGCEGGETETAFEYIMHNHGLTNESTYSYEAIDGTCNEKEAKKLVMITHSTKFEKTKAHCKKLLLASKDDTIPRDFAL
ncbi:hypothetical protein RJ639_021410 [Escallonia herrerae]|uniref:Peptidase C1A papain C-terminal domain-containing protein n=1 Tax=Escallonia herrerae TaxID=1293975 RepID=A0AA89AGA0_9ASTE|nr:hypothetical protein RJ639_021410 [Escallonia herrerae]